MIDVFFEDIPEFNFDVLFYSNWIDSFLTKEDFLLGDLTLIFCSDPFLLDLNKKHLDHDFFTDIITFDYSLDCHISGDLFISVDRVLENANAYNEPYLIELQRVIAHGVYHLCGYLDKTEDEILLMRSKEQFALSLIS